MPAEAPALGTDGPNLLPLRAVIASWFRGRVAQPADVDDLVQEVFTRVAARTSPEPVADLRAYLHRTAANVLTDAHRRERSRFASRHVDLVFEADLVDDSPDAERELISKRELENVLAALLELPERTRNIFVLRRIEGLAYRDIATRYGITVSAVEQHVFKALRHLLERVEDRHA